MLAGARTELHWAAQLPSAVGATWLPAAADYAHTNLGWDEDLGVLVGRPVGPEHLRAGLVFESLELVVLEGERERATLGLAGHDVSSALEWLREQMGPGQPPLALPSHDMPDHPVARGGAFPDGDSHGRAELSIWFANASNASRRAVSNEETASTVRCWPHHFDVASLVVLDAEADAEDARSIGVGFSPGDDWYDQPYFYVNPWPYPTKDALPPLEGVSCWHTEAWTGAVLKGEQVLDAGEIHQASLVADELRRAIDACRVALQD